MRNSAKREYSALIDCLKMGRQPLGIIQKVWVAYNFLDVENEHIVSDSESVFNWLLNNELWWKVG